jgi:hypothetical protein
MNGRGGIGPFVRISQVGFLRRVDICQFAMRDPGLGERWRRRIRFDGFEKSGGAGRGRCVVIWRRRWTLVMFCFVEIFPRYTGQIGCSCEDVTLGSSDLSSSLKGIRRGTLFKVVLKGRLLQLDCSTNQRSEHFVRDILCAQLVRMFGGNIRSLQAAKTCSIKALAPFIVER